ncbi:MAG: hypothetical protein ACREO7_06145 [Pseudoxanthomonas sp.]
MGFFVKQFQKQETDSLLERLATQELTDEARDALTHVLNERGISRGQLVELTHQSRKDYYLKTGATNQCDFCGKSLLPGPFLADGQKFCNMDCFHTSRLRQAAVDVTDAQALEHARSLKAAPCRKCTLPRKNPDIHKSHYISSMVFFVATSTESRFTCRSCANSNNLWAILYCTTLGWWSLKGIFVTPFQIAANVSEILRRPDSRNPSPELVDWARLTLAEASLKAAGAGKWGLRA